MNDRFIHIIISVLFLCFSSNLFAQGIEVVPGTHQNIDTTNLDIDVLKDKYEDMAGQEIERYKTYEDTDGKRPTMTGDEGEGNILDKQEESREIIEEGNVAQETSEKIIEAVASEKKIQLDSVPIYGFRYFRSADTKLYTSAQDVKPPYNYILGVGDQLNIAIWGFADYNEVFTIQKDGYIQPRYVGRIYLKGLTLENAIEVIKARYSRAYMIENSQFDVTLNYSRVISVNVVGEVEMPGSYTIPAVNTVFNLLSFTGGPTELGSIRNIEVKRNGVVIRKFDLYSFLNNPSSQDDYFLQNNDYIYVPLSKKLVKITGAVKRPFKYELLENETFEHLLEFAGGYKSNALTSYIQIHRYVNNKSIIMDVDLDSLRRVKGKLHLMNGDQILVRTIPEKSLNWVDVEGAVKVAGRYELKPGNRLSDLITRSMGLAENAFDGEAYVFRLDPGSEGKTVIKVKLREAIENPGSEHDILLQERDEIKVFENDYFIDKYPIIIKGEVRNPSVIQAQKGLTLRDGILYSGGLKPSAYLGRAYIKRINRQNNQPDYITVELDTANNYEALDRILIQQGDEVEILSNLSFINRKNVSISGHVKNSVVVDYWEGATVRDLLLMAGGMKERALLDKILIYRTTENYTKEIITIFADTINDYLALEEYRLKEEDNVIVFSNRIFDMPSEITVGGMLKEPGVYDYKEGMTLADALLLADGFIISAASNRIEVARISNFQDAIVNSEPTKISIEILEIDRDFINDPIANGYLINPFDQIYVRRIPDFGYQKKIFIDGEVRYPGTYVLKKNEKLTSIIERAGGLNEEAYLEGARLTRKSDDKGRLLVNLPKALRRPGSKYNYILKSGDAIYVPAKENIVTVRGQIDYPFDENDMKRLVLLSDTISVEEYIQLTPGKKINVPYTPGKRAKYYIKKYGSGFGKYSKRKDTYVILPNGHIKGTKFTLFGRVYPKVQEGSEVVVPRKPLKKRKVRKARTGDAGNKFSAILQGAMASLTASLTLYLLLKRASD